MSPSHPTLQPLPHALGVSAKCCHEKQTTLVFNQNFSWSGGKFEISDSNGNLVMNSEPVSGSHTQKKAFFSPDGQHLFTLRQEKFVFPSRYSFENPSGQKFINMVNKASFGKSKMEIEFVNTAGKGESCTLELRGEMMSKKLEITWNGAVIAAIHRNASYFSTMGKGRYTVDVAPGADVIMVAAIIIGLDMSIEDKNKKGGLAGAAGAIGGAGA